MCYVPLRYVYVVALCRYFCVEATKLLKVEAGENVSNEGFLSSVLPDLTIGTNLANF